MQQEIGGSSEERKQQQDRRLKPMMQGGGGSEQQQPQKCPRCESMNTKFCYYNNYSLSQPRYFCKTCRRYWTQGGTLRNVPVGGGCRKGKRTKTSTSSAETSRASQLPPPQQPQPNLTTPQNSLSSNPVLGAKEPAAGNNLAAPPSISSMDQSYYPTGGFLSLAAIQPQSFNPHPLHQALNVGGSDHLHIGGNLGLLQGFGVPSFGSTPHQQIQHAQIYQMGNREKSVNPMYHNPSEENLIQSRRPGAGSSYQGFINHNNYNPNVHDTALWSINSTSSGNTSSNINTGSGSGSLNPNQWPDLPGYGPP